MTTRRHARDDDPMDRLKELLDRLPAADAAEARLLLATICDPDDDDGGAAPAAEGAQDRRYAMDSSDAFTRLRNLEEARREVQPFVGEILGMDSAASVFREALSRLGVNSRELPDSALPASFRLARRGGARRPTHDAQGAADFEKRFPDAARIRTAL